MLSLEGCLTLAMLIYVLIVTSFTLDVDLFFWGWDRLLWVVYFADDVSFALFCCLPHYKDPLFSGRVHGMGQHFRAYLGFVEGWGVIVHLQKVYKSGVWSITAPFSSLQMMPCIFHLAVNLNNHGAVYLQKTKA
jgi:hypothetical protein